MQRRSWCEISRVWKYGAAAGSCFSDLCCVTAVVVSLNQSVVSEVIEVSEVSE